MHIVDSNMILLPTKKAQNLENVKTPDKFNDRELSRAIRDAIVGELNAIKQYEAIADAADNEDVRKVMQDISNEEKVHIGELQKVLNMILEDEEGFLEEGASEVETIDATNEEDTGDTEAE